MYKGAAGGGGKERVEDFGANRNGFLPNHIPACSLPVSLFKFLLFLYFGWGKWGAALARSVRQNILLVSSMFGVGKKEKKKGKWGCCSLFGIGKLRLLLPITVDSSMQKCWRTPGERSLHIVHMCNSTSNVSLLSLSLPPSSPFCFFEGEKESEI